METKKNEKKLVIKETEKKTVNKDNKNVKPISKKVSKTPLSKEDDLREKLAKASGKSVDEVKAKSNAKSNNVASDYDKVMARNKALKEVHEKMDKDNSPDVSQDKLDLDKKEVKNDKFSSNIISEQEKIKKFENKTKRLQNSNNKLKKELLELSENKKTLDESLSEIKKRLDEEEKYLKNLEVTKAELENNLKSISLESKNYRNIAEKSEEMTKKVEKQLKQEKKKVKQLKEEILASKAQIDELNKSLQLQNSIKEETVSKDEFAELKVLIKEKEKEIRAKERLVSNRDKKIEKITEDLKDKKKELRLANNRNKRSLKKIDDLNLSLKQINKDLNAANRLEKKLTNSLEKQEEEYKKVEATIAKEFLRLKSNFDKEINNFKTELSKKEKQQVIINEDKDIINKLKRDYEEKEKVYQDNIFKLENKILIYEDEIKKLKSVSPSGMVVDIMQEIKEEVVKNREIMQNISIEKDSTDVIDESLNYQQLIDVKEKELIELQNTNRNYLDEIEELLKEIHILNKSLQELNDRINGISEKDIQNVDFKRNIFEIRERKRELISRENEELESHENLMANLSERINQKKADIESVKNDILQTQEEFKSKANKSYSDKLEYEKQMRKLNYTLDLHEVRLNELSTDEKERIKNKHQVFIDDYNKRMKEYNISEQKLIEYYLGKTREEVISKEDEKLYSEQEKEKELLTQKLASLKQSQKTVYKKIQELKEEIFGLRQALEEINNPFYSDYEDSKEFVLNDVETKLMQLEKEYAIYQEKLQILNDKKASRFNIRNKLLMNEQIIFDYAKLFSYLKKADYLYRQNQSKQINLNSELSFGEKANLNKEQIKNEISALDKEQTRLYRNIEESRAQLSRIKNHEKVSYFIELESSIARLKIIEENLINKINETKNSISDAKQELNILKTGNY